MNGQESVFSLSQPSRVTETPTLEPISVCKCLLSDSSEKTVVSDRKEKLYSRVAQTETYLRERRIPELIRYFLTKIIANKPKNPSDYVRNLLDQCMLFRAGLGQAPVLYEERHLEAVMKSFDPGDRGWLSAGQVRRAFTTMGLTPEEAINERTPTKQVLDDLRRIQEQELYNLLTAGYETTSVEISEVSLADK